VKELIRRQLRNQQGFAIILIFIILLPVLFFICISSFDMAQMVQSGDMDLQEGLVQAVKGAAGRVDAHSQATGAIQIIPDDAHASFRNMLVKNIGLDSVTLAPLTKSYSAAPSYCMLVYNGTTSGALANEKYFFNGTSVSSSALIASGFPQSFVISGTDIIVGSGVGSITLEEPGVIGVISIAQKDLLNNSDRTLSRWAAARIKTSI
jgi:hypothetical protein